MCGRKSVKNCIFTAHEIGLGVSVAAPRNRVRLQGLGRGQKEASGGIPETRGSDPAQGPDRDPGNEEPSPEAFPVISALPGGGRTRESCVMRHI